VPAGVSLAHGFGRKAAEAVEQGALLRLVEAAQGLALRVHQRQLRRQLLEDGDRRRLIVDEHAALARGQNLAPQDDLIALRVDAILLEDGLRARGAFKHAGDSRLIRAVAHYLCRRLAPHQQGQGVHQNRLPCPGLAREQVQTGPKNGNGVVNNRIIFRAQFYKHPSQASGNSKRFRFNGKRVPLPSPSAA
jgi:hypothetical protein